MAIPAILLKIHVSIL